MTTEFETTWQTAQDGTPRWNESLARELAAEYGLGTLSPSHWRIIHTLREHFLQYGAMPPMRTACDINRLDPHCVGRLFHSPEEAWRIAGLPDPGEEARSYLYPDDQVQY